MYNQNDITYLTHIYIKGKSEDIRKVYHIRLKANFCHINSYIHYATSCGIGIQPAPP